MPPARIERERKIEMAVRLLRLAEGQDNTSAERAGERAAARAQAQKIIEKYRISDAELRIGMNTDYEKVKKAMDAMGHFAEYVYGYERWDELEAGRARNIFSGSSYDFRPEVARTAAAEAYYERNPLKENGGGALWAPDRQAVIADPGLMAAVNRRLGREAGEIYPDDLVMLEDLDASGCSIRALNGLEWAGNLKKLNLAHNPVSDISPLENMLVLREVNLAGTDVFDLSPLSRCRCLRKIDISDTPVRSAKPLGVLCFAGKIRAKGTDIPDLKEVRSKIRKKKYRLLI